MNKEKACEILEISDKELNLKEIKSNYRMLMKEFHPDKNKYSQFSNPEYDLERSKQINEAYDYLINYSDNDMEDDISEYKNNKKLKEIFKIVIFLVGISVLIYTVFKTKSTYVNFSQPQITSNADNSITITSYYDKFYIYLECVKSFVIPFLLSIILIIVSFGIKINKKITNLLNGNKYN